MKIKPLAAIRDAYADLLGGDDDGTLVALLRDLDAGYKAVEPPAPLRQTIRSGSVFPVIARPRQSRVRRKRLTRAIVLPACALIVLVASVAIAAGAFVNLGKPTNAVPTNPYFPLGSFHRVKGKLPAQLAHHVLFFGDVRVDRSAAETWPLVKALQQFGTISGTRPYTTDCSHEPSASGAIATSTLVCPISTFDLSRARLRSSAISFEYRSLVDAHFHCSVASMPAAEWAIFARYSGMHIQSKTKFCKVWRFIEQADNLLLPVFLIGDYVQAGIQTINVGDFQQYLPSAAPTSAGSNPTMAPSALSFNAIQSALATGKDPKSTTLNEDVNAEVNVITALICHSDRGKPAKVCNRPVIKKLLKRIK